MIGPDGSGKTTLSQEFKKEIKNKTCCFSKYYYIHGRFGILPNLSALLGNKKENTQIMKFGIEDVKNVKPYNKLKISIYMSYYFFDFLFGYLKLFKLKFSNTLIVADRYFYDYFYQEHFQKYPKIFYYMFMQLLPKPDLVIFLKADAQEIYKRKPEISLERINVQQQNIQKLINDMDNSITVDSSMQVEETYREIKGQILNQASK